MPRKKVFKYGIFASPASCVHNEVFVVLHRFSFLDFMELNRMISNVFSRTRNRSSYTYTKHKQFTLPFRLSLSLSLPKSLLTLSIHQQRYSVGGGEHCVSSTRFKLTPLLYSRSPAQACFTAYR